LQMGGSDQWGNIVNGIELSRRMDGTEVFGVTTPLLTTAGGAKMGKTADGAVWLNDSALPAFDFWQYWRNVDDRDVGKFLRLFTDLPLSEISRLEALEGAEINDAKKLLADAVTLLCRGRAAAESAAATARSTFEQGVAAGALPQVTAGPEGLAITAVLRELGFVTSNNEARRKLQEGAVRVSGDVITDPAFIVAATSSAVPIQLGAKRHGLVVIG
jgi:tyrosyl-tRNA synthetase